MGRKRHAAQESSLKLKQHAMRIEWLTVLLIVLVYAAYVSLLVYADRLPVFITVIALGLVLTLHSSLQHEVLHGHPLPNRQLSELLVSLPIGFFIPYIRFKQLHLQHHYDPNLTDPYDDPESNYLHADQWEKANKLSQSLFVFNNTLFGRMLIGPVLGLAYFYKSEIVLALQGKKAVLLAWLHHIVWLLLLLLLLAQFSNASLGLYLFSAYFALSILKIRTYLEHRSHEKIAGRTAIVESTGPMALLFLNNNYHAAHHANPKLAWYQLPDFYAKNKVEIARKNRNYYYVNYWSVFKQYFFKCKDPVVHPLLNQDVRTIDAHNRAMAVRRKNSE